MVTRRQKSADAMNSRGGYRTQSIIFTQICNHIDGHYIKPNRVVLKYIDFKKYVDLDVVKTTLEAGQAEMKTWHFDQTKGYVKVLDATYVKI